MIAERIHKIEHELPDGVQLVAVSKFHPVEALKEAYDAGQRRFGESRVQEFLTKIPLLPADIQWHFIGHLQTNKVKQIIGKTAMIESVDSQRLIDLIDRESAAAGVTTHILLQVHVAAEETKFGFTPDELMQYFGQRRFEALKATHICGIMGMATNTDDEQRIRQDFASIATLHHKIITEIAPDLRGFDIISMGMTDDWKYAVEAGSTLVRIGSGIFGPRQY